MARISRARHLPGPLRALAFGRDYDALVRHQLSGRVVFGVGTYGTPRIEYFAHDGTRLVVGAYTSIANSVTIILGGNHPTDRVTTYPFRQRFGMSGAGEDGFPSSKGDVRIGSDVWIGNGALILSGVNIGHGAVVAAGAVVSRDVEPFSVVAGNPSRAIAHRHTPKQREELLATAWWNWPADRVRSSVDLLAAADIDAFIRWASQYRSTR